MYDLDACECGHVRDEHEMPDDTRSSPCTVDGCVCIRFELEREDDEEEDDDEYDEYDDDEDIEW